MMRWNVLKLNGLSWNVSQCGDMGMIGKYLKYVPKYSNYVTLPHFGGLERLRIAHVAAMTLKVILCQSFCQSISNLVFGIDREYLDESLAHMFAKMITTNVNVLGSWA
jgi:hypothetical protein